MTVLTYGDGPGSASHFTCYIGSMSDTDATQGVPGGADDAELTNTSDLRPSTGATGSAAGPGDARVGPYRLVEKLGEGGMGQVWLAEQSEPVRRRVALKLIRGGRYDDMLLQRFDAERQALAIMEHPAIAKVFDAGTTPDGQPYFVMEYVDGQPITTYCDQRRLTVRARLELFLRVCEGVQHAHLKAIIHRDLKPSNVLVSEVDGAGLPRIIDFGIAKAVTAEGGDRTMTALTAAGGGLVGTLGYMSPEQADPNITDIDTRADVYALGVILYELLTGVKPFEIRRAPLDEILRRVREDDPPPLISGITDEASSTTNAERRGVELRQLASLLRGDLDSIAQKALARDRDRRYATPMELAADIRRFLSDQPVEARPAGAVYRMRKYVRRHRLVVALAAAMVVLVAAFVVVQALQILRVTRERDRADRIANFMSDMFQGVAPEEARGRAITAREVVDKAARDLESAHDLDPAVRARLLQTLGQTYYSLGAFDRGEKLAREAYEAGRATLGPDDPLTLRARARVGRSQARRSQYDEAEATLREVLAAQTRRFGPDATDTLETTGYIAEVRENTGRFAEAEALLRDVLARGLRTLGSRDENVRWARRQLTSVLRQAGKYDVADKELRAALADETRDFGADSPGALFLVNQLGSNLTFQQRYAEAETLLRASLENARKILGPDHPNTLALLSCLVPPLQQQGKLDEAEKLAREAFLGNSRVTGPDSDDTITAMEALAVTLGMQHRSAESIDFLTRSLAARRRTLGPKSPFLQNSVQNLAFTLSYAGRHAEADPYYRESVELASHLERQNILSDAWLGYAIGASLAGNKDLAFDCLRKSLDTGFGVIAMADQIGDLAPLQKDPRWPALMAEVKKRSAK